MAFYFDGAIQPEVPKILHREDPVLFSEEEAARRGEGDEADQRIAALIRRLLAAGPRQPGEEFQVMLLSARDEVPPTELLPQPIRNDTKTKSGKTWAWTMGHRYVSLAKLLGGANVTSELAAE